MPRYIEADALNAAIEDWFDGVCVYDVSPSEAVNDFQSIVDEQPTISPDDVRGVAKVNYDHGDYSCSDCGNPARRLSFARKKFCDECGAKLLWEVSEDTRKN